VPDEGLAGVIIILGRKLAHIETVPAETGWMFVKAGGGCKLAKLSHYCAEHGYSGLEFITGIPGSVGGAIATNAGCWGHEISEVLDSATILDRKGQMHTVLRDKLQFTYRQLSGHSGAIIVGGTFRLVKKERAQVKATCRNYNRRRQEKQPQRVASAGSFFKNPKGQAAGELIEKAGLKGRRLGGAMISDCHANFIINTGTATAADILALMQHLDLGDVDQVIHLGALVAALLAAQNDSAGLLVSFDIEHHAVKMPHDGLATAEDHLRIKVSQGISLTPEFFLGG